VTHLRKALRFFTSWLRSHVYVAALCIALSTCPPTDSAHAQALFKVSYDKEKAALAVYASADPQAECAPHISHLLIAVHGQSRNALGAAAAIVRAASEHGEGSEVLAVAPLFASESTGAGLGFGSVLAWNTEDWKFGGMSSAPARRSRRDSSFVALESLINRVRAKCSSIQRLTIAGHSAGGQFVNRFGAYATLRSSQFPAGIQFIVSNPSSYLYFSKDRPVRIDQTLTFEVGDKAKCRTFNQYQYGLDRLPSLLKKLGTRKLQNRYKNRHFIYLMGELDVDPNDSSLDTTCAAQMQGEHRLERAQNYLAFIEHFFGSSTATRHTLSSVPGVGHSATQMYLSLEGRAALFD
jgi:hypothetical protein